MSVSASENYLPEPTPLSGPLPPRARRPSAARGVAAASESFPVSMSPSPLIRPRDANLSKPPMVVRKSSTADVSPRISEVETKMAEMRRFLNTAEPPKRVSTVKGLPKGVVLSIFAYAAGNPSELRAIAATCGQWRVYSFSVIRDLTLIPDCTTIDHLSRVGALSSLSEYCAVATRGQHIKSLTIIDPRVVYRLPSSVRGPSLQSQALSGLLMNFPQLRKLDVRGIQMRNFAPWCDHFLSDLAVHCPQLEKLSIGAHFIRNWEAQWWGSLSNLHTFVVGSRREDCDWQSNGRPIQLPEDFFTFLRGTPSLKVVKVWATLQSQSFTQLILPSVHYPSLMHLSFNAMGNTAFKPNDDMTVMEASASGPVAGKKDAKNVKKGQEESPQQRVAFPVLVSIAIADAKDRPEFITEYLMKLTAMAPALQFVSVLNTHRLGPGKAPQAVAAKPSRTRAANP